jgi:N-acetylglutamate synthase-like GNAT family acetyltransferase
MNYSFNIRKAVLQDSKAIQNILVKAFSKYKEVTNLPHDVEAMNESIKDIENDILNNYVFIALIDNIPVGTVRLKFFNDKTAYLSRFAVNLDYHNIGIGKSLLNLVDKLAKSMDIKKISLYTASKHYDLVKFYYNRGFHIDSTTKDKGYTRALMIKEIQY